MTTVSDDERLWCADWAAGFGNPYLEAPGPADVEVAPVVEDGGMLRARDVPATGDVALAFVDGVRRVEGVLTAERSGSVVRGITGAHGVGAVVCEPGAAPVFEACRSTRYLVWEGGRAHPLPRHRAGFTWQVHSIPARSPVPAEVQLQNLMRDAERDLAEHLATPERLVVLDGPLNRVRTQGRRVIGYVKTMMRIPLDDAGRAVVATLRAGQRTSLFAPRDDIYSAYLRLPTRHETSAWQSTVRLEVPAHVGADAAGALADLAAALLPRYAGEAHLDPRAPQNLQPVAALERHLRHGLGDPALAVRAVREVIAHREQP